MGALIISPKNARCGSNRHFIFSVNFTSCCFLNEITYRHHKKEIFLTNNNINFNHTQAGRGANQGAITISNTYFQMHFVINKIYGNQ